MANFDFKSLAPEQWDRMVVIDRDGDKVGRLADVYADDDTGEPEWALVHTGLFGMRRSFVPLAEASVSGNEVRVPYDKAQIKDAPNVEPDGELSEDEEARLYEHYGLGRSAAASGTGPAGRDAGSPTGDPGRDTGRDVSGPTTDTAMTRSEEEANIRKTRRPKELVRLRKYVVTEHQTMSVPVSHEEVRVERQPVTDANVDAAMAGPELSDEEHEMTLTQEEVVTEKRVVPKERVRLDKDVVAGEADVDVDVRKEQIDVERGGKPDKGG